MSGWQKRRSGESTLVHTSFRASLFGAYPLFLVIAQAPPVAYFARLPPGWHQYGARQGGPFALSWCYRLNVHGWASVMPKGGIAVTIFVHREKTNDHPLRLVLPRRPFTELKGVPSTPEFRIHGRVRGAEVEVWVDIRQRRPTATQLQVAQRAISSIRFK